MQVGMSIRCYINLQDKIPPYSIARSSYDTSMWSAVPLIILAQLYLLGAILQAQAPSQDTKARLDYIDTEGVGIHKIITQRADWNTARRTCNTDGGYLVIINSIAEAGVVVRLLNSSNSPSSHVGVHDLYQEGEFVTIHGEALVSTGFSGWLEGEPNNGGNGPREDCVAIFPDGKLMDVSCVSYTTNFVCEREP